MDSFQLEHRLSFSVFGKTTGPSLVCIGNDADAVVYLDALGAVFKPTTGSGASQMIKCSENYQFDAIHASGNNVLLLEKSSQEARIVVVNTDDLKKRKIIPIDKNVPLYDPLSVRMSAAKMNGKLYFAFLMKAKAESISGSTSKTTSTSSSSSSAKIIIFREDQNPQECAIHDVHDLEDDLLDAKCLSFQMQNFMLCIQCESTFWLYQYCTEAKSLERICKTSYDCDELMEVTAISNIGTLVCHCWIQEVPDTVVFGTATGQLFSVRSGHVVCHLPSEEQECEIQCLLGLKKGFVAASSNGCLLIYNTNENDSTFTFDKMLTLDSNASVVSMSITSNEKSLFVQTLHPYELYKFNIDRAFPASLERSVYIHEDEVICTEAIFHVPLLVTAGRDKAVCVWNYKTGEQIVSKIFADIPIMISLHPFGKQILIAFPDEIVCAHILVDEFRTFWRISISCRICKFSNGGHQFALAHDNSILIFDLLSGEKLMTLKGHNSRVQSLHWTNADHNIISSDDDMIIYRWDMTCGLRIHECARYKSYPSITYIFPNPVSMWLFAYGQIDCLSSTSLDFEQTFDMKKIMDRIQEDSIILSSNENSSFCVASSSYPNNGILVFRKESEDYTEIQLSEKISSMSLSNDDTNLIVGFHTGTVIVFSVLSESQEYSSMLTELPLTSSEKSSEEDISMLVSDFFLQEKESIIVDICNATKEVRDDFEYRVGIRKVSNDEEVNNFKENIAKSRDKNIEELGCLQEDHSRIKRQHDIIAGNQRAIFQAEVENIEKGYKEKFKCLLESTNTVTQGLDSEINRYSEEARSLKESNRTIVASLNEQMEEKLLEMETENIKAAMKLSKKKDEMKEIVLENEEEVDIQIESARGRYMEKLSTAMEEALKASSENGILNKRYCALQRNIEDQKETIKILLSREEDMCEQVKEVTHSNFILKERCEDRNKVKLAKVSSVERQRSNLTQLEKLRYILEEKKKELDNCLDQNRGSKITKNIQDILAEFVRLNHENVETKRKMTISKQRINDVQVTLSNRRRQHSKEEKKRKTLTAWLQDCVDNIQGDDLMKLIHEPLIEVETTTSIINSEDKAEMNEMRLELSKVKMKYEHDHIKNQEEELKARTKNQKMLNMVNEKKEELKRLRLQVAKFKDKNKNAS